MAGVIPKADWATTAVGPMPTAPAESGGSRWIVWTAAAAAIALVAVVGGWLLHRAAAQLPGQEQVAPSAVAAITPTPALRVEPEEAPDPAEDPDEPAQEEQEAPGDDPADEEQAPSPAPDEDAEAEDESPAEDDDEDVEPAPDADPDPEPVARKAAAAQLAGPAEDCGKRRRSATHVVYNTETDDDAPWLALRSRPRTRARLRAKMSDGTKVKVYRQRRGWARVRVMSGPHKGRRGWAHNGWLQTLDCPENAAKSG